MIIQIRCALATIYCIVQKDWRTEDWRRPYRAHTRAHTKPCNLHLGAPPSHGWGNLAKKRPALTNSTLGMPTASWRGIRGPIPGSGISTAPMGSVRQHFNTDTSTVSDIVRGQKVDSSPCFSFDRLL